MTPTINKEQIKKIIPHRDPILLIDSVTDLIPGEKITAKYHVSPDMDIFRGHFPNNPVFPGMYTAECFGQASDILILSLSRYQNTTPYLIGLDKVKFMVPINPGDTIIVESEIIKERIDKRIVTCYAKVKFENKEEIAVEGEVTLAMR